MSVKENYGLNVSGKNKITVITGLPGSGKSHLIKTKIIPNLLKQGHKIVVVDVNKEYASKNPNLFLFRIKNYGNAENETEELIKYILNHRFSIDDLIIDESNVIFNKLRLSDNAKKLVNTLRHEKIDLYCIARRPVDINITISELAQKRYIFKSSGVNDLKRLNDIMIGLGDETEKLRKHDYLIVSNDSEVELVKGN